MNFECFFAKKYIFSLLILLLAAVCIFSQETLRKTVITIENAQNTRYEKDADGRDCIILTGNVRLSVASADTKNAISADFIRYDRSSEMLYAEGNITLEQTTSNAGGQKISASSLMFNTSTLEGIFDDGRVVQTKSDALNLPSGSTLIVASDIFGRSESNTIAFKNAQLTFCDDEDPHWHINASRIWLLPGGEFAFLNAFVYVGVVPVMYFPVFYYPKDELIYNPVFGYDKRLGYYNQNTFYVYGRKPLDSAKKSSGTESGGEEKLKALFNFIRPSSLKEQVREGIILHNLEKDFSGDTGKFFKIEADYYSNLGYMVGAEGIFKPKHFFTSIEAGVKLGFSNTVFQNGNSYIPYSPEGNRYWDKSSFMGLSLPFRYGLNLKASMSKPFSLSLSLPIYSDPFFSNDFSERSETMDWISYLTSSAGSGNDTVSITEVSSLAWTLNSSYSASLPDVLNPFISSLSMSLNSSLNFSSIMAHELSNSSINSPAELSAWRSYTPEKKFYYPSQITPATFSASISGTLIDLSYSRKKTVNTPDFVSPLVVPENFKEEKKEDKKTDEVEADEKNKIVPILEEKDVLKKALPELYLPSNSVVDIPGLSYTMKYSIKPSLSTQLAYSSAPLKAADDFDWKNLRSSMYTIKLPITLDNNLSYGGSFFSVTNSYTYNPVFQRHPFISTDTSIGGYTDAAAKSLKQTDYAAEKQDLTNTNSVSIKPFAYIDFIKNTGITWRSIVRLVRTEYDTASGTDDPNWIYHGPDWTNADSVTVNALDFTFAANQLADKFSQNLTVSTTLKPQAEAYTAVLKFVFPYTTLSFDSGIKKSSTNEDAKWIKQPFRENLSFSFFNNSLQFSQSYSYNLEDNYNDYLRFSLSWKQLQAGYSMSYTNGYDFDESTGWTLRTEKEFLPYSLSFSYSTTGKNLYTWKNRIMLACGLSTSAVADLLKPTDSYFTFSPSISFKIHEFLSLKFSSTSRNSVIYRYFGNSIGLPGEENIFKDLLNSFRFDDEELRKQSGFKLKSLKFELTHELHDWDFNTSFKIEPRLIKSSGVPYYDFNPYITISITWRPMAAMKTEIIDNYGTWELK